MPLTLIDTAGLRLIDEESPSEVSGMEGEESSADFLPGRPLCVATTTEIDPIEQEGAERARSRLRTADLVLLLTAPDSQSWPPLTLDGIPNHDCGRQSGSSG